MNLLSVADLAVDQLARVVATAGRLKADRDLHATTLAGRSIGLLFARPSLRTWVSCDVAAIQLGAHPVTIRDDAAGMGDRESVEDVGRVLARYLDLLALRVLAHTDLEAIAEAVSVPVVNLLSDREHPCQAVADLQTIAEHRSLDGATVAYLGDGNNVCHSLMLAASMMGCRMRVASPAAYQPDAEIVARARRSGEVLLTTEPREAVGGADVVYTDVWASMGQESQAAAKRRHLEPYRVTEELFERADPGAIFMHCLPAHRGQEVTTGMMSHPRSVVFDQAENRLHAFKAILVELLA